MRTLEEIKALVYPTEKVDWVSILKDLLRHKTKNGELVTFRGIYLYSVGDPDLYVTGVSLINNRIIATADVMYGGNADLSLIGTLSDHSTTVSSDTGIRLTDDAIKKICKTIFENFYNIDFDFSSMKARGCCNFCSTLFEERLKKREGFKETIDGYINGTGVGVVEW